MGSSVTGSPRSKWFIWVVALLVMTLTARLGWWQLDRAAQKTSLQSQILQRTHEAPWPGELARTAVKLQDQVHRQIRIQGKWLDRWTVLLDNRPWEGRPGFYVVTPLVLPDGTAVLVQRGWAPRHFLEREEVQVPGLPEGDAEITARISTPPSRLLELGESTASGSRIRQNLDLDAFALETGLNLRPLSLLQLDDPGQTAGGLRRDWPLPAADVSKHHGYAFQWFALSLGTLVLTVWFQIIQPRRRHGRPERLPQS